METLRLKARVGADGILSVEVPESLRNQALEIVITLQPLSDEPKDAMGYPIGYFEKTFGSIPDLEPPEDLPYEERDEIE